VHGRADTDAGQVVGTIGFVALVETCALFFGLMIITGTVIGVDALRGHSPSDVNPALYLLFAGTLGGVLGAAGVAWWLFGPIASSYRRGGLAMVAGFATVLLMLICIPIHQLLGRSGLVVLFSLCLVAAILLGRRARLLAIP
jgi:hypothetical protein